MCFYITKVLFLCAGKAISVCVILSAVIKIIILALKNKIVNYQKYERKQGKTNTLVCVPGRPGLNGLFQNKNDYERLDALCC